MTMMDILQLIALPGMLLGGAWAGLAVAQKSREIDSHVARFLADMDRERQ